MKKNKKKLVIYLLFIIFTFIKLIHGNATVARMQFPIARRHGW